MAKRKKTKGQTMIYKTLYRMKKKDRATGTPLKVAKSKFWRYQRCKKKVINRRGTDNIMAKRNVNAMWWWNIAIQNEKNNRSKLTIRNEISSMFSYNASVNFNLKTEYVYIRKFKLLLKESLNSVDEQFHIYQQK